MKMVIKMKKDNLMLEEKLYQDFNYDFTCLRHKLGLTQQEMADKSNVLRDKIAKIERGIYPPNIRSILNMKVYIIALNFIYFKKANIKNGGK